MDNLRMICALIIHEKSNISNLVLQKLLYFIQAYTLLNTGNPAFNNIMEAWTYGPVVPEVYYTFKNNPEFYNVQFEELNSQISDIVREVVHNLGEVPPFTLVKFTHSYDTWINAWNTLGNKEITPNSILEYHTQRRNQGLGVF